MKYLLYKNAYTKHIINFNCVRRYPNKKEKGTTRSIVLLYTSIPYSVIYPTHVRVTMGAIDRIMSSIYPIKLNV